MIFFLNNFLNKILIFIIYKTELYKAVEMQIPEIIKLVLSIPDVDASMVCILNKKIFNEILN